MKNNNKEESSEIISVGATSLMSASTTNIYSSQIFSTTWHPRRGKELAMNPGPLALLALGHLTMAFKASLVFV